MGCPRTFALNSALRTERVAVALKGETVWGTLSVASARRNTTLNADNSTAMNILRQHNFAVGADLAEGRDEIRAVRLFAFYLSNAWASSHS